MVKYNFWFPQDKFEKHITDIKIHVQLEQREIIDLFFIQSKSNHSV